MTKEALKLALDTFERMNHEDSIFAGEFDKEIIAIKESLAQPAQEPDVVMHCDSHTWTINNPPPKGSGDVNLYYAPAKEKNT